MKKVKSLYCLLLLVSFLIVSFENKTPAQNLPQNLSNLNVDDLTDGQIKDMLLQAHSSGYTDSELLQAAKAKGLPDGQANKLKARIIQLQLISGAPSAKNSQPRRVIFTDTASISTTKKSIDPQIFGTDLFNGSTTTFQPNLRLATPRNYVLGPDDQLNINLYGNSVVSWKLDVNPEGNIDIPGVGILNVSGKTVELATQSIKSKLSANNYSIDHGTTVNVSLGDIRSINVMVNGEVTKPGTYTLSSLSTVFEALYAARGPNKNGSMRLIEVIRNNRVIKKLDVYDFLLKSDQSGNIALRDQDIIRVPTYRVRVEMSGEVKRPAFYEVLPGETLQNVIDFSGGFSDLAYTANIKVLQIEDQQRKITDVAEADFKNYVPLRGDKYVVDKILETFKNRVVISGAVIRPGDYELENGLTVGKLIVKASGLRPDAFTARGLLTRLKPDNTTEIISFSVHDIINKNTADIQLRREDAVTIFSNLDIRDAFRVTINGEVRKPGVFQYADNLTVQDLILKAGGLTEAASPKRIEVSRRINNSDLGGINGKIAEVFSVDIDGELKSGLTNFTLKPFDMVSVFTLPGYDRPKTVKLEGEVLYPGYYTLKTTNERISDIIIRAGGLTSAAYIDGGTLRRANSAALGFDKNKVDTAALKQERETRLKNLARSASDSAGIANDQLRNNYVGIDLKSIVQKPGSETDLILEDGDVLRIPKEQQIVKVSGEVLFPSSIVYTPGKDFSGYVLNAGGYDDNALRRKAYIVYPNGTVKGTGKFLFFNVHPEVKPGSEIYVPKRQPRKGVSTQEVVGVTAGLATLGAVILGIINLSK